MDPPDWKLGRILWTRAATLNAMHHLFTYMGCASHVVRARFGGVKIPRANGLYHVGSSGLGVIDMGRSMADGDCPSFARISVVANPYQHGDTWYRDMRSPGFGGEQALNPDNSVQWLAQKIVADDRFAEAAVKFWWPAIMGREVAEPPEEEEDADFEGLLLAAAAQGAEVERLARGFRRGFAGRAPYNLKDLLGEIVLSKWFRADWVDNANPILHIALRDAGARRLAHAGGAVAQDCGDYRRRMGTRYRYRYPLLGCVRAAAQCIDPLSIECSTEASTRTGSRSGRETLRP